MKFKNTFDEMKYIYDTYIRNNKTLQLNLYETGSIPPVSAILDYFHADTFTDDVVDIYMKVFEDVYTEFKKIDLFILGNTKTSTTAVFDAVSNDIYCLKSHKYFFEFESINVNDMEIRNNALFKLIGLIYVHWLKFINTDKKVKVILTFRDPIASALSNYFYSLNTDIPHNSDEEDMINISSDVFIDKKLEKRNSHFNEGMLNVFDIDIKNNIYPEYIDSHIIVKSEDGIIINSKRISEFLSLDINVEFKNVNRSNSYSKIISEYKLDYNTLYQIYNSSSNSYIYNNIYNENERNKFIQRWLR